jgi:hypothetical protein
MMTWFISSQTDAMQAKELSRRIAFLAPNVAFGELTEEVVGTWMSIPGLSVAELLPFGGRSP